MCSCVFAAACTPHSSSHTNMWLLYMSPNSYILYGGNNMKDTLGSSARLLMFGNVMQKIVYVLVSAVQVGCMEQGAAATLLPGLDEVH